MALLETVFPAGEIINPSRLLIQKDGKFLVSAIGGGDSFSVYRFDTSGSLDPTFGTVGIAQTTITYLNQTSGAVVWAYGLADQPADNKIVVVGDADFNGKVDFASARFDADGTVDLSFGTGGTVITPFTSGTIDSARQVAIETDGSIVVAGSIDFRPGIVHYDANGNLDTSFANGNGYFTTDQASFGTSGLVIQNDGGIVTTINTAINGASMAVLRLTKAGLLDSSFGGAGIVTTIVGKFSYGADLALQPDGKIMVLGGYSDTLDGTENHLVLVRYNPNGRLDQTFYGSGGVDTTTLGEEDRPGWLALQGDGKIVVGADSITGNSLASNSGTYLLRFQGDAAPTLLTNTSNIGVTSPSNFVSFNGTSLFGRGRWSERLRLMEDGRHVRRHNLSHERVRLGPGPTDGRQGQALLHH